MSHDPQSPSDAADFEDDDLIEDDADTCPLLDCPQYYDEEADGWVCPLAGTEECDWICKE